MAFRTNYLIYFPEKKNIIPIKFIKLRVNKLKRYKKLKNHNQQFWNQNRLFQKDYASSYVHKLHTKAVDICNTYIPRHLFSYKYKIFFILSPYISL